MVVDETPAVERVQLLVVHVRLRKDFLSSIEKKMFSFEKKDFDKVTTHRFGPNSRLLDVNIAIFVKR